MRSARSCELGSGRADPQELINGFGRTGRATFRAASDQGATIEWVGIKNVALGINFEVVAWYDNEWGYSSRLVELAQRVLVPVAEPA